MRVATQYGTTYQADAVGPLVSDPENDAEAEALVRLTHSHDGLAWRAEYLVPQLWSYQIEPAFRHTTEEPMEQATMNQTVTRTNGMAIASLVLGIVWIGGIGAILALVFGTKARRSIDASGGREGGRGMATAGVVLGCIGIAGAVVYWAAIVIVALHTNTTPPTAY